MEVVPTSVDI
jgi:hypothetical protein